MSQFVLIAENDDHAGEQLRVLIVDDKSTSINPEEIVDMIYRRIRVKPIVETAEASKIAALVQPPGYRKKRLFVDRRASRCEMQGL